MTKTLAAASAAFLLSVGAAAAAGCGYGSHTASKASDAKADQVAQTPIVQPK